MTFIGLKVNDLLNLLVLFDSQNRSKLYTVRVTREHGKYPRPR